MAKEIEAKAACERLLAGKVSEEDREVVHTALVSGELVTGERAVAIGGSASDVIIVTGDGNVTLSIKGTDASAIQEILNSVAPRRLHQLPAAPQDFTGREDEIAELTTKLNQGGVTISALHGLGGIGKTVLALKLADQIKANYPDAQIFLDLKGTSSQPLTTTEAMAHVIRAYHPTVKLPDTEAGVQGLYQSVLHNQRALLLMDNAANAAQIEPLIPPTTCALLVTSRQHFTLPGLFAKNLDTLRPQDARQLLLKIAPRIDQYADEVARLCGYLPLALRLAASALAKFINLQPADYIQRLQDAQQRLQLIDASLSLSYELLSEELQPYWLQLAVFPDTFDEAAAAAVWQVELAKAQDTLGQLIAASMVEWNENTRRYRLHDLVRLFADAQMTADERAHVFLRHANHYLTALKRANHLYMQSGTAHRQGLDHFARESENIRAAWSWANLQADNNEKAAEICWSYTTAGSNLLLTRLPPSELKTWSLRSLAIATRLSNLDAELNPLTLLGLVDESIGEYDSAEAYFRRGASLAQTLGDNRNVAFLLQHLGRVLVTRGHIYEGIDNYERARQLLCSMGEHDTELKLVSDIALALAELRENHQAVDYLQKVLENARRAGNRLDEANALANLSTVWKDNSKPQAIRWSDEAAERFRELGYRHWQAQALLQSGLLRVRTADSETGIEQIKTAHMLYRDMGDGNGEARAVGTLGQAYRSVDRNEKAIEAFEVQLQVARRIGDRHREINALGDKGETLAKMGNYELAIVILKEARQVARLSGNDEQEFNTLCDIGKAYTAIGKTNEAITIFQEQVDIGKRMGLVSKQLHAFKHIADVYRDRGDVTRAMESMKSRVDLAETSRDHHDYPLAMFELSQFLFSIGQQREAITTAETARALFEQRNDPSCAYKVQSQIQEWQIP